MNWINRAMRKRLRAERNAEPVDQIGAAFSKLGEAAERAGETFARFAPVSSDDDFETLEMFSSRDGKVVRDMSVKLKRKSAPPPDQDTAGSKPVTTPSRPWPYRKIDID